MFLMPEEQITWTSEHTVPATLEVEPNGTGNQTTLVATPLQ